MDSIRDDTLIFFTAHYYPSVYDMDTRNRKLVEYGGDYYYEEDAGDEEEFYPCEINEWTISAKKASQLHTFSALADCSPTFAYIPGIRAIVYLDGPTQGLCAYRCDQRTCMTLLEDGTDEEGFLPSHIHPHETLDHSFYVAYPDRISLVETDFSRNCRTIMSADAQNVEALLRESTDGSGLTFMTQAAPCGNRFLLTLDTRTYEWNASKDTLEPRYNLLDYTTVALLHDPIRDSIILVHRNNDVCIFNGETLEVCRAICFHEPNYTIEDACMYPKKSLLALTFARADHEKLMLVNLITGETRICFSSAEPGETILATEFSPGGAAVLIVTQYACQEYVLKSDSLHPVRTAGKGERIAGGEYIGKEIEIVITPDKAGDASDILPRCEYHSCRRTASNAYYSLLRYYEIPSLTKELAPYFIFAYGDLGIQGPLDENHMQKYWLTGGIFISNTDETEDADSIPLPKLKIYNELTKRYSEQPVGPFQNVYFSHSYSLTNTDGGQHPPLCRLRYDWIDRENGKAVFLDDEQYLYRSDYLFHETYEHIQSELRKNHGRYADLPGWDYVIPWHDHELLCCYEGYRIMILDCETGEKTADLPYEPGIAVCGCDFSDSNVPESLKEMLRQNGAII